MTAPKAPTSVEAFGHGIPAVRHDTPQQEIEAGLDRLFQNLVQQSDEYVAQVREQSPEEFDNPDFCPSQAIKLPVVYDAAFAGECYRQSINLLSTAIERLERNGLKLIDVNDRDVLRFGGVGVDSEVEGQPAIHHKISVVTPDLYDRFISGSHEHVCQWVDHQLEHRDGGGLEALLRTLAEGKDGEDKD